MKNTKIIILIVIFVALLIVAALVFPKLRENYSEKNITQSKADAEVSTESDAGAKTMATDFTIYDKNGASVNLSDFIGKPTIVNFWATWCGYCVKELPDFNKLYEEYKDKINFVMLDLPDGNRETQEDALGFMEKEGYTFPVYFDTDYSASEAYSVSGIPMTLLIDKDGNLYQTHMGMMDEATLRSYIEALLGGEDEDQTER